jgi:hypothetical protein
MGGKLILQLPCIGALGQSGRVTRREGEAGRKKLPAIPDKKACLRIVNNDGSFMRILRVRKNP